MGKCQKWEWDKYFVTMTSRDITYFQGLRKVKKVFKHLVRANFGMLSQRLFDFFPRSICDQRYLCTTVVYHQSANNEQADNFSASNSESEYEVDSALETTLSMIRPTRRIRTLTSRTTDFMQAGMTGM